MELMEVYFFFFDGGFQEQIFSQFFDKYELKTKYE